MNEQAQESRPVGPDLIRRLHRRYLLVLFGVAVLVVLDQAVIQPALIRLTFYAPVINVAGRQRMLSQKLTKAALALREENTEERRAELREAIGQWSRAHHGLQYGDEELSLPGTESPPIVAAFAELEPHFQNIRTAALDLDSLLGQGTHSHAPEVRRRVETILISESEYLSIMDQIVGMYEAEAREQLRWLRLTGLAIAAGILLLLSGVGVGVLRPATNLLQRQFVAINDARVRLEERVRERTQQLSEANAALSCEIAERESAEARTRQLHDQLAHASRLNVIGHMATGLAHELNQPLGAINNYVEGCQVLLDAEQIDHERIREAITRIGQSAMRAGKIVRHMRGFVQARPVERSRVDLNILVREVVELCQPDAIDAKVRIELNLCESAPSLQVDAIQIQQVLVNLIRNGLQAMRECPPGARSLIIQTDCVPEGVRVEVTDTGPGFAPGSTESIFEPFFSTKSDGLGMGLSISRTIIQAHGGRLEGESRPKGGATLAFTLPHEGRAM